MLIDELLRAGVSVRVTDPEAMPNVRALYGDQLVYCDHRHDALAGADALAIATDWDEYRNPDFKTMGVLMRGRAIFDGRNLFDPGQVAGHGFSYRGIGRAATNVAPAEAHHPGLATVYSFPARHSPTPIGAPDADSGRQVRASAGRA